MENTQPTQPFTLIYYHGNMRPGFSYEAIPEETYRKVQREVLVNEMHHFRGYAIGTKNIRPYIRGECPHHCTLYAYTQVEKVADGFEHLYLTKGEGADLTSQIKAEGISPVERH